jgi:hypothetical protein
MCDTIVSVSEHGVLLAKNDEALARWTETVRGAVGADRRPVYIRRYWSTRDRPTDLPASRGLPAGRPASRQRIV